MKEHLIVAGIMVSVVVVFFGFAFVISKAQCVTKASALEVEYRWGILAGCNVRHPGGLWVPVANYRAVGD